MAGWGPGGRHFCWYWQVKLTNVSQYRCGCPQQKGRRAMFAGRCHWSQTAVVESGCDPVSFPHLSKPRVVLENLEFSLVHSLCFSTRAFAEHFGLSSKEPEKGADGTIRPARLIPPLSSSRANSLEGLLNFHWGLFIWMSLTRLYNLHALKEGTLFLGWSFWLLCEGLLVSHFLLRGPKLYNQTLNSLDKRVNCFQDVCLFFSLPTPPIYVYTPWGKL